MRLHLSNRITQVEILIYIFRVTFQETLIHNQSKNF